MSAIGSPLHGGPPERLGLLEEEVLEAERTLGDLRRRIRVLEVESAAARDPGQFAPPRRWDGAEVYAASGLFSGVLTAALVLSIISRLVGG